VVGGKLHFPPENKTKTGPRLKYWLMQAGHRLVKKYRDADVIFNFGSCRLPEWVMRSKKIINHPARVEMCARKDFLLKYLQDLKLDFVIPKTWFDQKSLLDSGFEGKLIVKPFMGRGGKGKFTIDGVPDKWGFDFKKMGVLVQEFIDIHAEYRCVYIYPDYFALFRKCGGGGEIRNAKFGWCFKRQLTFPRVNPKEYNKICRMVKLVADLVGIKLVGMDIGIRKVNKEPFIIEANTCTFLRDRECKEASKLVNRLLHRSV